MVYFSSSVRVDQWEAFVLTLLNLWAVICEMHLVMAQVMKHVLSIAILVLFPRDDTT
jgi:hypothetical protein